MPFDRQGELKLDIHHHLRVCSDHGSDIKEVPAMTGRVCGVDMDKGPLRSFLSTARPHWPCQGKAMESEL